VFSCKFSKEDQRSIADVNGLLLQETDDEVDDSEDEN
jgi:hypothetical protein